MHTHAPSAHPAHTQHPAHKQPCTEPLAVLPPLPGLPQAELKTAQEDLADLSSQVEELRGRELMGMLRLRIILGIFFLLGLCLPVASAKCLGVFDDGAELLQGPTPS